LVGADEASLSAPVDQQDDHPLGQILEVAVDCKLIARNPRSGEPPQAEA